MPDDQESPSGNSGDRVPCGPLVVALSRVSVAGRLVPATRLVRPTDDHAALLARLGFVDGDAFPRGPEGVWLVPRRWLPSDDQRHDHGWLAGGRSGVRRLAELLGSLGLFVGLLGRVATASIAGVILGGLSFVHWQIGFFMN